MEDGVLGLFRPFSVRPGEDAIGGGVILDAISIDREVIRVGLKSGDDSAQLVLMESGTSQGALAGKTASFDAQWSGSVTSQALLDAGAKILEAVASNDAGTFFQGLPDEPAPDAKKKDRPEASVGYSWHDFIGEAILAVLAVLFFLSRRLFAPVFQGRPRYLWLGLAVATCAGFGYRLFPGPVAAEAPAEERSVECIGDGQCDDYNACTRDACIKQLCRYEWAPPPGSMCCQADSDCRMDAEWCWEYFCDTQRNLCTERPKATCREGTYGGVSGPPANTSVGWLYAVPAKYTGNTRAAAHWFNVALSSLSILLLGLTLLSWGAPPPVALASSFLLAVLPVGLVAAQSTSMVGLLAFLALLFFLVLSPLFNSAGLSRTNAIILATLSGIIFFLLESARPEALLVLLPAGALLASSTNLRQLDKPALLILAGLALVSVLSRVLLLPQDEFSASFPTLSMSFFDSLIPGLDTLFVDGTAVPFMLVLLALFGLPLLQSTNRQLFWLPFLLFLAIPIPPALFALDQALLMRFSVIPCISLPIMGGYGLWWIGTRKVSLAWLAVVILVVYFAVFPMLRLERLQSLSKGGATQSLFLEM